MDAKFDHLREPNKKQGSKRYGKCMFFAKDRETPVSPLLLPLHRAVAIWRPGRFTLRLPFYFISKDIYFQILLLVSRATPEIRSRSS